MQCIASMSKTNTTPGPGAADFSLNTRRALARKVAGYASAARVSFLKRLIAGGAK